MEIINNSPEYGPTYRIGPRLRVSRNSSAHDYTYDSAGPRGPLPYWLMLDGTAGTALSEEEMLELMAAFLLVYESYDHPEGAKIGNR